MPILILGSLAVLAFVLASSQKKAGTTPTPSPSPAPTPGGIKVVPPRNVPGGIVVTPATPGTTSYAVTASDTPQSVAAKFGISQNDLYAMNGIVQKVIDQPVLRFALGGFTFEPTSAIDNRGLPVYSTNSPLHPLVTFPGARVGLAPIQWGKYEDNPTIADGIITFVSDTSPGLYIAPWHEGMLLRVPGAPLNGPTRGR